MKTVHMTDHMTFPIRGPEGEFEVDVFYSDDWRVTEICIAGENGATVNEEVCHAAISVATTMSKVAQAQIREHQGAAIDAAADPAGR
jgi:hypothetical protein